MRYTIYEDPLTHKFALVPLPARFVEGDKLPGVTTDRWFGSRAEAIAALPEPSESGRVRAHQWIGGNGRRLRTATIPLISCYPCDPSALAPSASAAIANSSSGNPSSSKLGAFVAALGRPSSVAPLWMSWCLDVTRSPTGFLVSEGHTMAAPDQAEREQVWTHRPIPAVQSGSVGGRSRSYPVRDANRIVTGDRCSAGRGLAAPGKGELMPKDVTRSKVIQVWFVAVALVLAAGVALGVSVTAVTGVMLLALCLVPPAIVLVLWPGVQPPQSQKSFMTRIGLVDGALAAKRR